MLQVSVILVVLAIAFLMFGKNVLPVSFDRTNTGWLRGLMALLVVAHHTSRVADIPYVSSFLSTFEFGEMIVSVFFMLSGYGLFVSYKRKGATYLDGFLSKRLSKILPAFLFLTLLSIIIFKCCDNISLTSQATLLLNDGEPPLWFSWFIYAVIYIYIAFYASAVSAKTPVKTGWMFSGFILAYIVLICLCTRWRTTWYATIPSAAFGYFIGLYEDAVSRWFRKVLMVAVVMLCCSYVLVIKMTPLTPIPFFIWKYFWLMSETLTVYMLVRARALGFLRCRLLIWIGTFSMELYLVHGLVIYSMTDGTDHKGGICLFCAVFAISISLAYILHRLIPIIQRKLAS